MKFIDLFAGIGGFHLGLEKTNKGLRRAEQSLEEGRDSGDIASRGIEEEEQGVFDCVWANEWDKYAAQVYKKRFPKTELSTADIRTVDAEGIPNHDLLCAGFPCQSFSIAGKRKGFDDTRGTLFFEIARIIEAKQPKIVLLENVKGLLSHENGKTFGRIIQVLGELGYWLEWQVLNSKDFGVPQNRERVFIVGHLGREGGQAVFPIQKSYGETEGNGKTKKVIDMLKSDREISRVYNPNGLAPTLHLKTGGWQEPKVAISNSSPREFGFKEISPCLASRDYKEPKLVMVHKGVIRKGEYGNGRKEEMSFTLDRTCGTDLTIEGVRRLTPTECERLQGFPDGFTEGLSDTQRYKCLGNAVTVNVVGAIGREIIKSLGD